MRLDTAQRSQLEEYLAADHARLFRLAYALMLNRDTAEDLLQETLVRLAGAWGRLDDRGPHGYATATMVRVALHQRARAARRFPTLDTRPNDDPQVGSNERIGLTSALRQLPERQRAAVALRYLCDLTERQTAEVMGCSVGTVKSQTSKALSKLSATLVDSDEDAPAGSSLKRRRQ